MIGLNWNAEVVVVAWYVTVSFIVKSANGVSRVWWRRAHHPSLV
jgi:hypothetical protein